MAGDPGSDTHPPNALVHGTGRHIFLRRSWTLLTKCKSAPKIGIWALVANKVNDHFREELSTRGQLEELKLATARTCEANDAGLPKEVARADEAHAWARQWERKDQALELRIARDEITRLTSNLDASTGNIATVTALNLTTTTDRIGQLEQEVVELPKARAELAAARERVKEEVAIVARV